MLKSLNSFLTFDMPGFISGKRLVFIKAQEWKEESSLIGSKVIVQIVDDNTKYPNPGVSNFGEQLTVKVRGAFPETFNKIKPLTTEVEIVDVERATVYGEYRNQLSIIAVVKTKGAATTASN